MGKKHRAKKSKSSKKKKKEEKRKAKQKRFKKEDSGEESTGDDQNDDSSEEDEEESAKASKTEKTERKQLAPLPEAPEKPPLLGALLKGPEQPPWFKIKLFEDIRPDLVPPSGKGTFEGHEIDLLDNFMRGTEELQAGDLVIVDDNLDEESREYSRYEVLMKYNEGRYSAVYIVAKQTCTDNEEALDNTLYAMKTGLRKDSPSTRLRFKRELAILKELKAANAMRCPRLVDSGRVCDRSYIVMTLLDRNLEKLRENLRGCIRHTSVYHLAAEALSAIEELHALNYVHRDIKPTNFCIGLAASAVRLYLIDFGEAVKNGRNIRYAVPDAYSLPYMAIDAHQRVAAKPKMDLESWFYTFSDMLYPQLLTWKQSHNEVEIQEAKTKFWNNLSEYLTACSPQIVEAAKMINTMTDKADYSGLRRLMDDGRNSSLRGAPFTLEWVKEMPKVLPKRSEPIAVQPVQPHEGEEMRSVRSIRQKAAQPGHEKASYVDELRKSLTTSLVQRFRFRPKKKKLSAMIAKSDVGSAESSAEGSAASDTVSVEPSTKPAKEKVEPAAQDKKAKEEPKESAFSSLRKRKIKIGSPWKQAPVTSAESTEKPAKAPEQAAAQPQSSGDSTGKEAEAASSGSGTQVDRSHILEKLKRYSKKSNKPAPVAKDEAAAPTSAPETPPQVESAPATPAGSTADPFEKSIARRLLKRILSLKKKDTAVTEQPGAEQGSSAVQQGPSKDEGQKESSALVVDQKETTKVKEGSATEEPPAETKNKEAEGKSIEGAEKKGTEASERKVEVPEKKSSLEKITSSKIAKRGSAEKNGRKCAEPVPAERKSEEAESAEKKAKGATNGNKSGDVAPAKKNGKAEKKEEPKPAQQSATQAMGTKIKHLWMKFRGKE